MHSFFNFHIPKYFPVSPIFPNSLLNLIGACLSACRDSQHMFVCFVCWIVFEFFLYFYLFCRCHDTSIVLFARYACISLCHIYHLSSSWLPSPPIVLLDNRSALLIIIFIQMYNKHIWYNAYSVRNSNTEQTNFARERQAAVQPTINAARKMFAPSQTVHLNNIYLC